jgi:lipoate-protein ligase A
MKQRWRFLGFQVAEPQMALAIDDAIAEAVSLGESGPTIRFYGWSRPAVSIGRYQEVERVADKEECARLGVELLRRRTGGGAVLHSPTGEVTYSVICPEQMLPRDIILSYQEICGWVISALRNLGVEASFRPINDVVVGGKKISGSAQSRRSGVLLQHGTALHSIDEEMMEAVLRPDIGKLQARGFSHLGEYITCLADHSSAGRQELLLAMAEAFLRNKEWYPGELTPYEEARAEAFVLERYSRDDWNLQL